MKKYCIARFATLAGTVIFIIAIAVVLTTKNFGIAVAYIIAAIIAIAINCLILNERR